MEQTSALLIIDMQKGSFPTDIPCHDFPGVLMRINSLGKTFRDAGLPVIVIQHNGAEQGEYIPGTEDWQLVEELSVYPGDMQLEKRANDCFYGTNLQQILSDLGVAEVVITGSATDFCIDSTVQSALIKNLNVTVAKDAHTMTDRPNGKAEQFVDHYNWVWSNLTPTRGKISIRGTDEIEQIVRERKNVSS
jgi:nicotinamidase-related amidase